MVDLGIAPFNLDREDVAWVQTTLSGLSEEDRIAQLFNLAIFGNDRSGIDAILALRPGGITRFFGPDAAFERQLIGDAVAGAAVPPLVSADLEGSRLSLPFGTPVLNPIGLAAVDDVAATEEISRIMAEEARAVGVNWSFTPVLDINHAFRSAIVATRGFGSDIARIERHALAQMRVFQAHGVAATAKHWPGEGYDDRDQHLVTTINPLSIEEWDASFGRLYRSAIDAGVLAIMSAHIAFPAFVRSIEPNAGINAFRPASVHPLLTQILLRERLGFNGLVVSDATPMAGLGSWMPQVDAMPQLIAAGCDMILFSQNPQRDIGAVRNAVASGVLSRERVDEALMRILGLKAKLGLHQRGRQDSAFEIGTVANRAASDAVTSRAPTLVKDVQGLLPLDPVRHRRVLVVTPGIIEPLAPGPQPFAMGDMLAAEGFEITNHVPGTEISRDKFDLVLFLFGDETLLTRNRIFIDWRTLMGGFEEAMSRHWHDVPTLMISFGYPYHLYDAPRVPTYVNAWSTLEVVQKAVVGKLLGRSEFVGGNPVDPFCGLEDARY